MWASCSVYGWRSLLSSNTGTCRIGRYPDCLLEHAVEQVRALAEDDPSMWSLEKSCANAAALYKKTRPPASAESVKRARELPPAGPHPRLAEIAAARGITSAAAEAAKVDITNVLRRFRPAATVLEAQVCPQSRREPSLAKVMSFAQDTSRMVPLLRDEIKQMHH
jgi:hypothetical protein